MKTIGEVVYQEVQHFKDAHIQITDGYMFSQYNTIRRINGDNMAP